MTKISYAMRVVQQLRISMVPEIVERLFTESKLYGEHTINFPDDHYIRTSYDDGEYYTYIDLKERTYLLSKYSKEFIAEQITSQYFAQYLRK